MNVREMRGRKIAAGVKIRRNRMHWIAPSQSGQGNYLVTIDGEKATCTCRDFELRAQKCKHVFAVEYLLRADVPQKRDTAPMPKPPRPTYRQDWPAYNLAQTNEKAHFQALLHDLCRDLPGRVHVCHD